MRIRIFHIVATISFLLLFACSRSTEDDVLVVKVNISTPEERSIFDFVDRVELIQLENSPEAMLSGARFTVSDNSYYMLDYKSLNIYRFSTQGNLITKVRRAGRGTGEYTMADDIVFYPQDSTIRILNPMGLVYRYSVSEGFRFLDMMVVHGHLRAVHNFWPLDGGRYLLFSGTEDKDRVFLFKEEQEDLRVLDSSYPAWVECSPFCRTTYPFYDFDGKTRYYSSLDGYISTFNPDSQQLDPYLRWDFGKNQFEISDINQSDMESKDNARIIEVAKEVRKTKAAPINGICETNLFILASAYFRMKYFSVVYEKDSNNVCSFETTSEGVAFYPEKAVNGDCFSLVTPDKLTSFVNESVLTDENSRRVFREISDDSNMIMIRYHMKR